MCEQRKAFIEFCCMGHEMYFTEDFQSEEDENPWELDIKNSYPLSFMPEPLEDIQAEINLIKNTTETGTQCENSHQASISKLSLKKAINCEPKSKTLTPSSLCYSLTHTAKVFFPKEKLSFPCKRCDRVFKNTQALGGHMSRKH